VLHAGSVEAIAAMPANNAACVAIIHPRLRPSHGGTNRSMNGAQRNFKVYGRPTSVKIPMVRRSTSATVSHAWRVPAVSASGRPDENPSGSITAMRR
jgi:hypothetical protein